MRRTSWNLFGRVGVGNEGEVGKADGDMDGRRQETNGTATEDGDECQETGKSHERADDRTGNREGEKGEVTGIRGPYGLEHLQVHILEYRHEQEPNRKRPIYGDCGDEQDTSGWGREEDGGLRQQKWREGHYVNPKKW